MPKDLEKKNKEDMAIKAVKKGKATENKAVIKEKNNGKEKLDKKLDKKIEQKKSINKNDTKLNVSNNKKLVKNQTIKSNRESLKTKSVKNKKEIIKRDNKINKQKNNINNEAQKLVKDYLQEYYDLPYRYNETIVTILAQTPKRLFVYWDISDKDRENYKKAFGDDFFEKTYPVLLVHNEELNYTFEVPINDFANSWYLDIQDSKKSYVVQLGRKFKNVNEIRNINYNVLKQENINLQNDYIYITGSNKLEAPNDHILFESLTNYVTYRNVKNGNEFNKELKSLVNESSKIYPEDVVHELYTKLYSEEIAREEFGRKNPGSEEFNLPTSSGKCQW